MKQLCATNENNSEADVKGQEGTDPSQEAETLPSNSLAQGVLNEGFVFDPDIPHGRRGTVTFQEIPSEKPKEERTTK